ncbi:TetR family transcriptional regulator [Kitasatospora sp. NPDC008050]|uniref:TetR family transcriptional regulator n=1 Tax=Kitasatospora sp. NPDC008050 TaxID=3364021 RepID=UPI0036F11910
MPRWKPDARQRLVVAALGLFAEQGYDETTVAQIAERAELTRSTFFRHFADKREILTAGQRALSRLQVAAELGVLAFRLGYTRWADPAHDEDPGELAALTRAAFDELRAAAAGLN